MPSFQPFLWNRYILFVGSIFMTEKIVAQTLIWYLLWLSRLYYCCEICCRHGPRKHIFCWSGGLEEWFNCTVCLLSLQPSLTVYAWLHVSIVSVLILSDPINLTAVPVPVWYLFCMTALLNTCLYLSSHVQVCLYCLCFFKSVLVSLVMCYAVY